MALLIDFIEERFPEGISYGSFGGPQFNTNIITVSSGFEQRNINWSQARAKYTVNHGVKTEADIASLLNFFRTVQGRAIAFRYKDWSDYQAVAESIGTGDALTTQFQLKRTYTYGAGLITHERVINKPVAGSAIIYLDGVADPTAIVDDTTGLVTFTTPPAAGVAITADFEFDVPCRFNTDNMNITLDTATISTWSNIEIVEIRL